MAGSVDLLQRCFAGIELRSDTLWINPYWPPELGSLEFDIVYRGQLVTIWIDDEPFVFALMPITTRPSVAAAVAK